MKKQSKKTTIQIMYETVMERGGPQGPFSKAIVDAYEGRTAKTYENKRIIQFRNENPCRLKELSGSDDPEVWFES